ncbi:acyltransferase family protein [Terrisporobacter mayombei]|uniref:acyltransferase family protein n=1 Tax=Terrisporobacter mayombei TaxID=1541 RepID=UPI0026592BF0|nr:acyltransferase family protein [Terrisporobacter mayombei]MCC3671316.1 acyltransferase family protein [Terrisporobacter mayombei]
MNNKNRLYYLDNTRGFALLGVVIGHIYESNNAFINWIYSFHVPLFFIISGALLYYKDSINKVFLAYF